MSLDDRLQFGEGPLGGTPPEFEPEEPAPRRRNRAFIFLAIAMGGLIVLGILALVAALVFIVPQQRERASAAMTETVAAATALVEAWTPTFTPSPTVEPTSTEVIVPTSTPMPTPTSTRVVGGEGDTREIVEATATRPPSADWGATTPSAGLGGFGAISIAVGLTGLMFAVRQLRLRR